MARLEPAHLGNVPVSMNVNGAVAIPEPSSDLPPFTFSPTSSLDSAIGDSPRPSGSSGKYLTYGGPGFSVASFDAVSGSVDRIPVPLPLTYAELAHSVAFPQSTVLCLSVVGETQVWVGTEAGSLHVFELSRHLRFSSHSVTTLDGSLLSIASRHSGNGGSSEEEVELQLAMRSLRIDVLLGSSNGALAIISGEAVPGGGLKNPDVALKKPRKIIDLGEGGRGGDDEEEELVEEGEEEGGGRINCITPTQSTNGEEVFWCSYGRQIVVIQRDGWEEIGRMDGNSGHPTELPPLPKDSEVVQLVSSELGIWSSLSYSSTVTLWDIDTLEPKLSISCCSISELEVDVSPSLHVTSLHLTHPYLFVGTSESDLLVFRIIKRPSSTLTLRSSQSELSTSTQSYSRNSSIDITSPSQTPRVSLSYRLVTAEHCGHGPILDMFTCPLRTPDNDTRSPFHSTVAPPTSLQLLVVCGAKITSPGVSSSIVSFYEIILSPSPSPLVSPLQLPTSSGTPTRPFSAYDRRCSSATSNISTLSSTSRRRNSGLYEGSLPKLSLFSAAPSAHSLLPLRSS